MNCIIREIRKNEYHLLDDFLYEAIFIPEGVEPPPRDIIQEEALQVYIKDFGKLSDDRCLMAEVGGRIIGAVWVRIMNDYGHVDDSTPSLAISLYKEYRGHRIGTQLMKQMLELLKNSGYKCVSLSVRKANYAAKMYLSLGFEPFEKNADEMIMICVL